MAQDATAPQPARRAAAAANAGSAPPHEAPKPLAHTHDPGRGASYIAPPLRRLGPHAHTGDAPRATLLAAPPVEFHLRKLVGLVVAQIAGEPRFTAEFLDEATRLAAQYMLRVAAALHKMTEVQRHHRPGLADLAMCLEAHGVDAGGLHGAYTRTRALAPQARQHAARVARELGALLRAFHATQYTLAKDDPALVFHANEQHEIAALVPRQATPRAYIPPYLPDLPPDFTFTLTGHYVQTTTDLKEIKLRLAEESQRNEASLYRLIDDDERRWRAALERELRAPQDLDESAADDDGVMSDPGPRNASDTEPPEAPDAAPDAAPIPPAHAAGPVKPPPGLLRFDFVAYAQKRTAARDRRARETARRRRVRLKSVFLQAEASFSPYARAPPSRETRSFFGGVLERSFQAVIRATRAAEEQKRQRLAAQAEERRRHEDAQAAETGAFEFGFAFNPAAGLLDDSDDDRADTSAHFDFGDPEQEQEHAPGLPRPRPRPLVAEEELALITDSKSEELREPQVSGKVPLKGPPGSPGWGASSDVSDCGDNLGGDIDKREPHCGPEDAGPQTQCGVSGLLGSLTMGTAPALPNANEGQAHVLWGGLSEESEEDELEDIE